MRPNISHGPPRLRTPCVSRTPVTPHPRRIPAPFRGQRLLPTTRLSCLHASAAEDGKATDCAGPPVEGAALAASGPGAAGSQPQPPSAAGSEGGELDRKADAGSGSGSESGPLPVVPWGVGKIAQVMLLWLIAYVVVGQVAVPILMALLGLDREQLSIRGHAILHLGLDVFQLGITLLILQRCLGRFKLKELGVFPVKWRGAWPLVVLAFCTLFPLVDWLAQQNMTWFPTEGDQWANQMEHNLSLGDWITNVSYFCLVSICAPIWEEAIFRGFLLASLARYMPVYAAMLSSSLLFAMCHFRLQTFLPLLALGIIFSSIFLLTRNLLPPIILHSLWNIFVLCNLLFRPA